MTQTIEDLRYQLEEWLAQGFTSPEDRASYQTLKEQYEDETLDYSFSKREIIGQYGKQTFTRAVNYTTRNHARSITPKAHCHGKCLFTVCTCTTE